MIGPEKISAAFEELTIQTAIFETVRYGIAYLAATFFLLNIINIIKNSKSIDFTKVFLMIIYIVVALNYNSLFYYIEGLVSSYADAISSKLTGEGTSYVSPISNALNEVLLTPITILSNSLLTIVLYLLLGIAWIINTIIMNIFYIERSFLLWAFNLLIPFIIALSVLDNYRDLFWSSIKLYCAIIITGILFRCADYAMDFLFTYLSNSVFEKSSIIDIPGLDMAQSIVIAAICVFAKPRLFMAAISFSYKIFKV